MKTIVIVPARYASTRFPGKPLALLGGREIILRVMERVADAGFDSCVATDDARIYEVVSGGGFRAVMTSANHQSGTDRIREALDIIEETERKKYDIVINVQGDEPFVDTTQLQRIEDCFSDPGVDIATLCRAFPSDGDYEALANPNLVKLVKRDDGMALYFSRSVIPFLRGKEKEEWQKLHKYYTHIGIYGYRADILRNVTELKRGKLENAESLEQLRWLEAGYRIKVRESGSRNIGIDTPEDLADAELYLKEHQEME